MMSREEYDTLTPAERDQQAGGWWYDGPAVEQLDPRPAPRWVYDVDLDTRRGRILWTLTLALALALVWGTCLLMYAGALWIAGLL